MHDIIETSLCSYEASVNHPLALCPHLQIKGSCYNFCEVLFNHAPIK